MKTEKVISLLSSSALNTAGESREGYKFKV